MTTSQNFVNQAIKQRLSPELLHRLLRYDSDTAKLFWRKRSVDFFEDTAWKTAEEICRWWNTRFSGKQVGTVGHDGYLQIGIFNILYLGHRVIWAMETGAWPINEIDHINHDKSDNRIENLREATHQQNSKNQTKYSSNTSGYTGVGWNKQTQKWRAYIRINQSLKHLGYYDHISEAAAARKSAERKYGFHENHGVECVIMIRQREGR